MKIKGKQKLLTWAVVVMLLLNTLLPLRIAYAEEISPTVLTGLSTTVKQDGTTIPEGAP